MARVETRSSAKVGGGASGGFLQSHLASAETVHLSVLIAKQERPFVVQAAHGPVMAPATLDQRHRFTPEQIITVPEVGEGLEVLAFGKNLVGEQDAANERGGEPVDVELRARDVGEGDGASRQIGRPS